LLLHILQALFLQHGFMVDSLALWQEDGIWITVLPSDADQIVIWLWCSGPLKDDFFLLLHNFEIF